MTHLPRTYFLRAPHLLFTCPGPAPGLKIIENNPFAPYLLSMCPEKTRAENNRKQPICTIPSFYVPRSWPGTSSPSLQADPKTAGSKGSDPDQIRHQNGSKRQMLSLILPSFNHAHSPRLYLCWLCLLHLLLLTCSVPTVDNFFSLLYHKELLIQL